MLRKSDVAKLRVTHIPVNDLEALRLFQVHAHGYLLSAYIEFDGLALAYLLFLPGAQLDVIDLLHVFEFLLQSDVRYSAMDD